VCTVEAVRFVTIIKSAIGDVQTFGWTPGNCTCIVDATTALQLGIVMCVLDIGTVQLDGCVYDVC
jgi:hypothetical protein